VLVVVALQLVVPLRALVDDSDRQQRFGWAMYSAHTGYPDFTVEHRDGRREEVALGSMLARARPEVDYARDLPSYLCTRYPDARAVLGRTDAPEPEITRCG
jgi:hypothetical protein